MVNLQVSSLADRRPLLWYALGLDHRMRDWNSVTGVREGHALKRSPERSGVDASRLSPLMHALGIEKTSRQSRVGDRRLGLALIEP
jgi:hypothetical protein